MPVLPAAIHDYLHEILGVVAVPRPWAGAEQLPAFLREAYTFLEVEILGAHHLLMVDNAPDEAPATRVSKQVMQVETRVNIPVVYARERMTTINRKRLIERKVAFIAPGSQLYLPGAGVVLREHVQRLRRPPEHLGPVAQGVMLDMLLNVGRTNRTPGAMARRLGYPAMAMSRAFDELEALELVRIERQGRERRMNYRGTTLDLWRQAQPMLTSPVRSCHVIQRIPAIEGCPAAGLDALARRTALASPLWPIVAVSRAKWKMIQADPEFQDQMEGDPDVVEVEVWNYPPLLFARDGVVDPISLRLSLAHLKDERVESALEDLTKGLPWSKV